MVGVLAPAEPEVKLGISAAKTPRPQRSENNNKRFFQDNLSSLRNLACFAPLRESSLLIASFMSNSKCLHLRGTTLALGRSDPRSFLVLVPSFADEFPLIAAVHTRCQSR